MEIIEFKNSQEQRRNNIKFKIEYDKDFKWDKYFKQVGIYQGRSFWHDLRDLVVNLKNKIINQ